MPDLEKTLDWLRPLILGSDIWNYCIIWKLGDDPSRFIEWVDCCCNGNVNEKIGLEKIKIEDNLSYPLCKDHFVMHPVSTKACEALTSMPSSMSLYSGIHGEVVISNLPRWLNISKKSHSLALNEQNSFETRVLIPVAGGLVELFSSKHIPEDQRMIEYVKTQSILYSQLYTTSTSSSNFDGHFMNLLPNNNMTDSRSSLNQIETIRLQNLTRISHPGTRPSLDGSSTGSFPSSEHTSPDSTPCPVSQGVTLKLWGPNRKDRVVSVVKLDSKQKPERERCKSKNLHTERRRRNKIKDGLFTLRSLVPNISKMDRAAILIDAIDYILELENQIKEYKDELNDAPKEDNHANKPKPKTSLSDKEFRTTLKSEVQVIRIGTGHFLVRIKCQHNAGVLTKMLECLVSLGLHINDVKDTNVVTCDGTFHITLILQTNKKDIQVEDLRVALRRAGSTLKLHENT